MYANRGKAARVETIHVVAAAIIRDNKVLATQRGYGDWAGWWELPGGKVEEGEASEEALAREIREELDAEIEVGRLLCVVDYYYPKFHLIMDCFVSELADEGFTLVEHRAARWLAVGELDEVKWLPGDVKVVEALKRELEH